MNPKIKTAKIVTLLSHHLTEKTLSEYICSKRTENGTIKLPPKNLPLSVHLYEDYDVMPIIQILPVGSKNIEDPEIPKDLLDLINWGIKNGIEYIQLNCFSEDLADDELKKLIEIESELPIYDCPVTE